MKAIDDYLSAQSEENENALQSLRNELLAMLPDAEEAMVYGVPGLKLNGKSLVCYAGFKKHCGFYPMSPAVIKKFESDLKNYETAKGTIRFQPNDPIPVVLIRKMVEARLIEISR